MLTHPGGGACPEGKSCLHRSSWQMFPLTLAGLGFSHCLYVGDGVEVFRHDMSVFTCCERLWEPEHTSNAPKYKWRVRDCPQDKAQECCHAFLHHMWSPAALSVCRLWEHPRQWPYSPSESWRGLGLLACFWLGDFFVCDAFLFVFLTHIGVSLKIAQLPSFFCSQNR